MVSIGHGVPVFGRRVVCLRGALEFCGGRGGIDVEWHFAVCNMASFHDAIAFER